MLVTGPFHVGFTWTSRAYAKREGAHWFDGDNCAAWQEKSADTVRSCFGTSGVRMGSNERLRVPKGVIVSFSTQKGVKPDKKKREDQNQELKKP